MKNILILLLVFSIGFGSAWYLRAKDITAQVENEQIAKWKGDWCSENCGYSEQTQQEADRWLEGFRDGYKAK